VIAAAIMDYKFVRSTRAYVLRSKLANAMRIFLISSLRFPMYRSHKFFLNSVLLAGLFSCATATTKRLPFTGNVAYSSNYLSRGITQSNDNFSLQGGFDYAHESGFYLGTWAAGVEFRGTNTGDLPAAYQELDGYGGYKGVLGTGLGYDLGFIHYAYPGANSSLNYDFNEVYISLGYRFGTVDVGLGVKYSNDYWGGTGNATYTHAKADYKLDTNWSVSLSAGHQTIEDNVGWGHEDHTVVGASGHYALADYCTATVGWSKANLTGDLGDHKIYAVLGMRF